MAEARARRNNHFTSNIFKDGPAETPVRQRSVNPKNYESSIFIPADPKPVKKSYSREKYFETSEIFSKESFINPNPTVLNSNQRLNSAGFKERYTAPENILGNDRSTHYKKKLKKCQEPQSFAPKYDELTIQQKIEKELYGGFHVIQKTQNKKIQKFEESAKQRKKNNLVSSFDKVAVQDENANPISENTKREEYSASKRKFEILASGVFAEKKNEDFPRVSRREEFDEKRKKHHLYSDLTGRSEEYTKVKRDSLVSTSQNWLYQQTKPNNRT